MPRPLTVTERRAIETIAAESHRLTRQGTDEVISLLFAAETYPAEFAVFSRAINDQTSAVYRLRSFDELTIRQAA